MSREHHTQNGRYKTNQQYLHEPVRPVNRHFPDKLRAILLRGAAAYDLEEAVPLAEGGYGGPDPESWREEFEEDD